MYVPLSEFELMRMTTKIMPSVLRRYNQGPVPARLCAVNVQTPAQPIILAKAGPLSQLVCLPCLPTNSLRLPRCMV